MSRRRRERRRRLVGVVMISLVMLLVAALMAPRARAGTDGDLVTVNVENGSGRAVTPGRSCSDVGGPGTADNATGAYWHYEYGAEVTGASRLGNQRTEMLVHLDLHSDLQQFPNVAGDPYPDGTGATAFLQGSESHASLLTDRGSIKVRLSSGTCAAPTLEFDGSEATGEGEWSVDPDSLEGSYRGVTGGGSFELDTAEVNPGGDNELDLTLSGSLTVPNPALKVEFVRSYWGGLGTDYLTRRVTTVYRVTNTGPGDSFSGVVTGITDLTSGVKPMIQAPFPIRDLRSGESQQLVFRHQLGLLGPCLLVVLNCKFQTRFDVNLPDAFDQPHGFTATVMATAPLLPPPL